MTDSRLRRYEARAQCVRCVPSRGGWDGQAPCRRAATASAPSRLSMPRSARTPAMSASVRASCFGLGAGGAGVEGTDGVGGGVDELRIEGVDGVGVAEGVCNRRHWLGCRRDCRGERWGFCTTRSPLAACRRRVGGWCGAQIADHLGEQRRKWGVVGEVVCVLGAAVFWHGVLRAREPAVSHINLLLRVLTRYVACEPAIWSVGGSAQARISWLTCR